MKTCGTYFMLSPNDDSWETYAEVYASEFLVPAVNCQVNKIV